MIWLKHFVLINSQTKPNQSAHRTDPSKRARIRLILGARLESNGINGTAYFTSSHCVCQSFDCMTLET